MTLTSEYQYIGRSNEIKDQNSQHGYYILLYAKTTPDNAAGRHTVTIKQRLASTVNTFYGYSTIGNLAIAGATVAEWNWANVPGSAWDIANLTEGGVTYRWAVDLREGSRTIDIGYGSEKDINIAATWTFVGGEAGYLPKQYAQAQITATVTLEKIASASQPSLSASTVELEAGLTIYTNRTADFTHAITYQFGNESGVIAENVGDQAVWYPDIELARQIPDAVTGTAIITCTTYAGGSPIGSNNVTVVLKVPDRIVPAASAVWQDISGAHGKMGVCVKNVSALKVDVTGTGAYGSTPTGSAVSLNGKSYGGGLITDAGALSLVVYVTDSRGRTGSTAYTVNVADYSPPSLSLNASRCTADGAADESGDHAIISVSGYVTQVNGSNQADLTVTWGTSSETITVSAGDVRWQKLVAADPNDTMPITAVLTDKLVAATRTMVLSTGYATLDFLAGGRGISLGKAATREGFDCAMPAYFSGGMYAIAADGTVLPFLTVENVTALEAKQ